jgi:UDP-N-acetylglucosamine 2-epimerase
MKLVSIVGARPQFVKLAPLSKKLRENFTEIIIHTGQHYDDAMSNAIFKDLNIPNPDYNLGIGSGGHGEQTGKMLIEIEKLLLKEKPAMVVVFGDTNSTIAGSLTSTKLHIPVIHVEAGLRSFNRQMPEEINRIATDHISDFLFAPTKTAMEHLGNEGLLKKSWLTGDIMFDTLKESLPIAIEKSQITKKLCLEGESYYLLTLHRPYNVDNPDNLRKIIYNIQNLGKKVVFPIHPRTKKIIIDNKIEVKGNIVISEPLSYFDFLKLEYFSDKILTDSGGIQKEAYFLKKPCITFRTETEWIETIQDGWNILLDPASESNYQTIIDFVPKTQQSEVFGNNVASKMSDIIIKEISNINGQ